MRRGDRLKELREKHGYSRKELAEKLYVTEAFIQGWEEGWDIINPSSGEIAEMADAFGIDEEKLRFYLEQDEDEDYDIDADDDDFKIGENEWAKMRRQAKSFVKELLFRRYK